MGKKNNKINKVVKHNMNNLDNEIYRFIVIFFIIALVVIGLYFLSKGIVSKRNSSENTVETIEIAYDKLNVGMIFNRPYDEYYVIAYDSTIDDAMVYSTLITNYTKKENSIKIYYCDLNKIVNKEYKSKDGKSNPNASSVQELSFNEVTLLKIRNKKVVNYIDNIDQIKRTLK